MLKYNRHPIEEAIFKVEMHGAVPLDDSIAEKPLGKRRILFDEDVADLTDISVRQVRLIHEKGGAFAYKIPRVNGGFKRVWSWPEAIRAGAVVLLSKRTNLNIEAACKVISAVDEVSRQTIEHEMKWEFTPFIDMASDILASGVRHRLRNDHFRICISDDRYLFIEQNIDVLFLEVFPLANFDDDGSLNVFTMEQRRSVLGFADGPLDSEAQFQFNKAQSGYQSLISIDICKIAFDFSERLFKDD